jgi:hypothetical protein
MLIVEKIEMRQAAAGPGISGIEPFAELFAVACQ